MTVREWELLCPGSTQVLEKLVQKNHGQLEEDQQRSADDPTNRVVSWKTKGISYSLSMMAEDGDVYVWATAWRDNETTLMRRSIYPLEKTLHSPTTQDLFQTTIDEVLKEIKPKVGLLNLRGTLREVLEPPVITSRLTPYPRSTQI